MHPDIHTYILTSQLYILYSDLYSDTSDMYSDQHKSDMIVYNTEYIPDMSGDMSDRYSNTHIYLYADMTYVF